MRTTWAGQSSLQAPTPKPIPELTTFDGEQFRREFLKPRQPVLYRGVASAWKAVQNWTPEHLQERYVDVMVEPSINLPDMEMPYQFSDASHRQRMSVAAFVSRMARGECCYLDQADLNDFPGLKDEFNFDTFEVQDVVVIGFWMGSRTRSGLHYDHVENLFAQVYGVKEVLLLRPGEMRNLYPFADCHTKSRVSPEHPQLQEHPRYANAQVWSCQVRPGDVLYVPRCWWHYLKAPERSISLSCWFGPQLTPKEELKMVLESGRLDIWTQAAMDFVRYGLLKHPYQRRLFSPPPTGVWLHDYYTKLLSGLQARRHQSR